MPELENNVRDLVADHMAGDPMREDVVWTYLSAAEISEKLWDWGTPVSRHTVVNLLKSFGFAKRKAQKKLSMGASPYRNEQFENIARLKLEYFDTDNPIISMDTKKKEWLGNFYRDGEIWTTEVLETFDHDFGSAGTGKVVPHGLYDVKRNVGHINLGLSHDTSQFACDSFLQWWRRHGEQAYPNAASVLLLCDGGGSNNCRHNIFKEDLQRLVNKIGIPIRVAHYPPYCSKYNPIEHRLFAHVTRVCRGVIFHTVEVVKHAIKRTWTSTGLRVTVGALNKFYELKRQVSDRFMEAFPIVFDDWLPDWNYTAVPTDY
jgi:hypothetical protein